MFFVDTIHQLPGRPAEIPPGEVVAADDGSGAAHAAGLMAVVA
ncbi:hypothetical protein ACIGJO_20685 [Streptomyces sp. NPDC079020]